MYGEVVAIVGASLSSGEWVVCVWEWVVCGGSGHSGVWGW